MDGYGIPTYINIDRTVLKYSKVITLSPKGWLNRSIKNTMPTLTDKKIVEVIFIPNTIPLLWSDEPEQCTDDDHFCSILCDQGFIVHIISITPSIMPIINFDVAISEVINWRTSISKSSPSRNSLSSKSIALVAQELSVPRLLNWLSETVTTVSTSDNGDRSGLGNRAMTDIGAVVLVDPPPLQAMAMNEGRLRILRRYSEPLLSSAAYKRHAVPLDSCLVSDDLAAAEWKRYLARVSYNTPLSSLLYRLATEHNSYVESPPPSNANSADYEDYAYDDNAYKYRSKSDGVASSRPFARSQYETTPAVSSSSPSRPLTTSDVLGDRPKSGQRVGEALPHRILVLSSRDIQPLPSFDHQLLQPAAAAASSTSSSSTRASGYVTEDLSPPSFYIEDDDDDDDEEENSNIFIVNNKGVDESDSSLVGGLNASSASIDASESCGKNGPPRVHEAAGTGTGTAAGSGSTYRPVVLEDPDDWGLAAAEELADVYRAGAVIAIPSRMRLRGKSDGPFLAASTSAAADGVKAGGDGEDYGSAGTDEDSCVVTESWHKELADIVADWLNMLVVFEYL